ncbi:MAG: hypothetical protein C0506_12715 [Anaerolinea sp.]|nr:hypothetical protein [Anaerolinea sp.]
MPASTQAPALRAILFDLDQVLVDSRRAWQYALEEGVASVSGRRVDALPLVGEYQHRPWPHVLSIVLAVPDERARCAILCAEIMRRSALKKLLVFDGIGMALDALRAARLEIGAVSRETHDVALKQVQSTGLDRFLTVLAATPEGDAWDAPARYGHCLAYLESAPPSCALVTADAADARSAQAAGFRVFEPRWVTPWTGVGPAVPMPASLLEILRKRV